MPPRGGLVLDIQKGNKLCLGDYFHCGLVLPQPAVKDFPQLNRLLPMHSITTLKQRYSIRLKPTFVDNDLRALVPTLE